MHNIVERNKKMTLHLGENDNDQNFTPFSKFKNKISDIFIDKEKMCYKEGTTDKLAEWAGEASMKTIKRQQSLIEKGFEALLETFVSDFNKCYWKDTGNRTARDFETIK